MYTKTERYCTESLIINCQLSIVNLPRRAFTLVELLMVVIIISILAGLSVVMMDATTKSAKESKTRSTIDKLDDAIQQIFEGYEEKLVKALEHAEYIVSQAESSFPPGAGLKNREDVVKKMALHFIRDRMRMELPSHWADVYDSDPAKSKPKLVPIKTKFEVELNVGGIKIPFQFNTEEPPVFPYYYQTYKKAVDNGKEPNRSALLFLIIQNLNPDALETFHGSEIGDTDGDGLPEFLDAWGHPILFLRWTPGFSGSDKQPNVIPNTVIVASEDQKEKEWTKWLKDNRAVESQKYSDPFDEDDITDSWFLYPLVYSAGADGMYGIAAYKRIEDHIDEPASPEVVKRAVPAVPPADESKSLGILDPFAYPYGMPINESSSSAKHFDNIHNHRMNGGF
jgi:prepilin-type N-terminal cleavage/methylation domain-containing protein